MDKRYVGAESLLIDSFKLAKEIYESGFVPEKIIGIWRGGSLVTLAIDEYFRSKGLKIKSYPLKVEAYSGSKLNKEVLVFGFEDLKKQIEGVKKLLVVDDVFDTGSSLENAVNKLMTITKEIKIATVYYKPRNNRTNLKPDFYLHETSAWIVFPHELEELTMDEIKSKNERLHLLLTT